MDCKKLAKLTNKRAYGKSNIHFEELLFKVSIDEYAHLPVHPVGKESANICKLR
jgi:hypothetical protein